MAGFTRERSSVQEFTQALRAVATELAAIRDELSELNESVEELAGHADRIASRIGTAVENAY